jgi:hypothetical protein
VYKLGDVLEHVGREVKFGFSNHLFLGAFLIFVVFLGTFGIWFSPAYDDSEKSFIDAFDKVGMLTYCAPLLSVTIFDASLRAIITLHKKENAAESGLYAWGAFLTIALIVFVAISLANAPRDVFSFWSLSAGFLSIFYWFVVNASNDSYKKPTNNSSPSGRGVDDSNMLLSGGKKK